MAPLLTRLRDQYPDLAEIEASKATLTITSRLVEELVVATPGPNLLVSAFQRDDYWDQARGRYHRLAETVDVVVLTAGDGPPREHDELAVRLRADHDLAGEWIVLALGPDLAVVLCGRDQLADVGEEDDRQFGTVWSYDPAVVRSAAELVLADVAVHAKDGLKAQLRRLADLADLEPDARAVARAADQLTSRMLASLEEVRRREREAERQVSQAKTQFLSRMGHELRNPLNAILGYAQLLELDMGPEADTAQRIGRAGEHLLALVDEVLDISQVESGRLQVSLVDVALRDLALEALDLIRTEAAVRGIVLEMEGWLETAARVHVDRRLTIQVLLNLLSNAVKFSPRGSVVRLEAAERDDGWHVCVADEGPGIPPDDHARVFEPFERLAGTASGVSGTGLGLALSRTMAQAMDARLELESAADAGATFTLVLPAASA